MPILKLKDHDEAKERQFELESLSKLTVEQRFQMMLERSKMMKDQLNTHGHRRPPEIIKRQES